MAEDWIKWVKGLYRKPEVLTMAARFGIPPTHMAGLCMVVWEWADESAEDGVVKIPAAAAAGHFADLTGQVEMFDAMVDVGWLKVVGDTIIFVNSDRHMGESAKKRAKDQARKQAERNGKPRPNSVRDLSEKKRTKVGPEREGEKSENREREKRRNTSREFAKERARDPSDSDLARAKAFKAWNLQVSELWAKEPSQKAADRTDSLHLFDAMIWPEGTDEIAGRRRMETVTGLLGRARNKDTPMAWLKRVIEGELSKLEQQEQAA